MKKSAFFLSICVLISTLSACTLEVPSILEAKKVVDAYVYYNKTGKLPPDINEILSDSNSNNNHLEQDKIYQKILATTPSEILEDTLKEAKKKDIIRLTEEYYNLTHPKIEAAAKSEYNRLVTWKPNFSDKKATEKEMQSQQLNSINVVLALSYTNAKNFYVAMAAATFSLNFDNITAAGNFAAALASYADDLISEGASTSAVTKYYEDAEAIYHYALLLAGAGGKYNQDALSLLVSLGNLYLDGNKHEEAYACFKSAMEINKEYSPAIEGLFNTFMALRQYKEAMELIAETSKYPVFTSASNEIREKVEEGKENAGKNVSMDEENLGQACEKINAVESVSIADFLDEIDSEAKDKLNQLIRQVQDKMVYTVPDPIIITQFSSVQAINQPAGVSALEAYREGVYHITDQLYELQARNEERMSYIDSAASDDATEKAMQYALQYQRDQNFETLKLYFDASAQISPEFGIYTLNPYEYANPIDIIVQRKNLEILNYKLPVYSSYLAVAMDNTTKDIDDIINSYYTKIDSLLDEMDKALEQADPEQYHQVHNRFNPRLNSVSQVAWSQATQAATAAYQNKMKKQIEQMYNDCMKHIILISDDDIRTMHEEELQLSVLHFVVRISELLHESYSFASYFECDCPGLTDEQQEAKKKKEKEAEKLANEQILKNMEAKKRFDSGILDENSAYYKKVIEPYEVKINTPFLQGIVGPYKSGFKMKIDIPGVPPVLEYSKMEYHTRNTTTYNGGIEISAGKGVKASAYLKFTAMKNEKGQFAVDDIDIIGGGKFTLSKDYASTAVGFEASAVKGTRSYANFSIDGDYLLNSEFKKAMGYWKPNLKKVLWSGEYTDY